MSNRFCFVAPMFDAAETVKQMLLSIVAQSYTNWRIILIDDVSSSEHKITAAKHIEAVKHICDDGDKINVLWNLEKKWEVTNVLTGIATCADDDIICRIDADDVLCDVDALMMLDQAYNTTKCDVAWTMHRWGFSDRNISAPLPKGANPYVHPWCTSHLKTFRKRLINDVPYVNFTNMNGDPARRCGDQAVYLPVLHRATNRLFVPRVMYRYNIDERGGAVYQTDDAKFQKAEADFIRARGYVQHGTRWEDVING